MKKKSIVLLGENDCKGVLSLENNENNLNGWLRLYNFGSEPQGIISLGIYSGGKVVKAGLTKCSEMLYTFKEIVSELPDKFSCAVVNFNGGQMQPILYGNSEGCGNSDEVFGAVISSLTENSLSMSEVEQILDESGIDYDDDIKSEIQQTIEDEFEKGCSKCKYREYYYANHIKSLEEEDKSDIINREQTQSFYQEIKAQIDNLFEKNPTENYLEDLIPNSKWVKVDLDDGGNYYVFGLLYEDDNLKYICYGVPGIYQKNPPKNLSGYPVWFPLDRGRNDGFGYWLSYQDAISGESVKAIVE